MIENHVLPT